MPWMRVACAGIITRGWISRRKVSPIWPTVSRTTATSITLALRTSSAVVSVSITTASRAMRGVALVAGVIAVSTAALVSARILAVARLSRNEMEFTAVDRAGKLCFD